MRVEPVADILRVSPAVAVEVVQPVGDGRQGVGVDGRRLPRLEAAEDDPAGVKAADARFHGGA